MNALMTYTDHMNDSGFQYDSVVVGLGKTGRSVIDYLLKQKQSIAVVDSRLQPPELDVIKKKYPRLPVFLGGLDEKILCSGRQLVLSPGISPMHESIQGALAAGAKLSSDIEIFCQQVKAPVIAITGSNGKSSVATLLSLMIQVSGKRAHLAGNIGLPALDVLEQGNVDFFVLELSSFQLDTVSSLKPVAAVVLNVSPDHMDRYASYDDYVNSKKNIYRNSEAVIVNLDDARVVAMGDDNTRLVRYGTAEPEMDNFGLRTVDGDTYLAYGEELLMKVASMLTPGQHNVSNALAALALGSSISLSMDSMLSALREFSGLPHRCQQIAMTGGVSWYNDSKGTNVGASCAAIESLSLRGPVVLIAGGDGKNADFSPLARTIKKHVKTTILIGKDASLIDKTMDLQSQRLFASSMQGAVATAHKIARTGDSVLLSPACASQDMYKDYQHRGDEFTNCVLALQEQQS
ncbi:MAG: UDP-N-acetylmuramoyl-L-alanine--D-glutamate ligase [Gammaproteobacteria bacterium]|nr:UDP-N-acetylmuramoyl-L-alanine--D-glutamate ligase [Gammaproteobacteria bacterium]